MQLQVAEHRVAAGESVQLGPAVRIVYRIEDDAASYATDAVSLDRPAHVLYFELVDTPSAAAMLSAPLELADGEHRLIRCDRVVDFPPGGVAYLHTHQGPGLRVLLSGEIQVQAEGRATNFEPLHAWFEPGTAPVFAVASLTSPTAFVRCMVLPEHLRGKSSIRYVRDEDAEKSKPQRYRVFVDEPLREGTVAG